MQKCVKRQMSQAIGGTKVYNWERLKRFSIAY